jgi:hypothetical protein
MTLRSTLSVSCCDLLSLACGSVAVWHRQPANQTFNLYICIVAREAPPVIVGLETAVEMNLVQIL